MVETAEGEMLADFAVKGSDNRMEAIEHMNNHQHEWVHTDAYGNQTHELALNNPEVSQLLEDDFEGEIIDDEAMQDAQDMEDAFYEQTVNFVGGANVYNAMTDYALQNWDSNEIDSWNAIMDEGDFEQRALAVQYLLHKYQQHIKG